MKYEAILALDPSGNFNEGKGTTGWCTYNTAGNYVISTGFISAKDYDTQEAYWDAHLKLIEEYVETYTNILILVEDYVLYESKAMTQTHSRMETPKVIGIIEHHAWQNKYSLQKQPAHEVKNRWTDPILAHEGIIKKKGNYYVIPGFTTKINRHCKDAIRHAVHYNMFKNK